jgi:hypothetical protein
MSIAVAGEPHKSAGAAFGEVELLDQLADRFTFDLWG